MNPFEFFIPQNIIVGAGTLVRLPECAQKLGGTHAMLSQEYRVTCNCCSNTLHDRKCCQ